MIPNYSQELDKTELGELEITSYPSRTYFLDFQNNRIIGMCDGTKAIEQTIYKILCTERYTSPIYTWIFGIEMQDINGSDIDFVLAELEERIEEALAQDDRIEGISDFRIERQKKKAFLFFTAITVEGTIDIVQEVGNFV